MFPDIPCPQTLIKDSNVTNKTGVFLDTQHGKCDTGYETSPNNGVEEFDVTCQHNGTWLPNINCYRKNVLKLYHLQLHVLYTI